MVEDDNVPPKRESHEEKLERLKMELRGQPREKISYNAIDWLKKMREELKKNDGPKL